MPNRSIVAGAHVGFLTSRLLALWVPGNFGQATTFSVLVELKYTSKSLLSSSYAQSFIPQYWPQNSSTYMYTRVKCVQYGVFTRNTRISRAQKLK